MKDFVIRFPLAGRFLAGKGMGMMLAAWLVLGLNPSGPSLRAAAAPSGSFNYGPFNNEFQKIYDLTGTYTADEPLDVGGGQTVNIIFLFTVVQDAKGKLSGSGNTTVTFESQGMVLDTLAGEYTVKGKVKSSDQRPAISMKIQTKGEGMLFGSDQEYQIDIKRNVEVVLGTTALFGPTSGKLSTSVDGIGLWNSTWGDLLPTGMDGSWNLNVDFQPDGTKLLGSATILLSNGMTLPAEVKGKYSEKTDLSKFQVKGTNTAKGAKLKMETMGTNASFQTFKGKVMGQKIEELN